MDSPSTIFDSTSLASATAVARLKEEFRSILISISPSTVKNRPSNQSDDSESSSWYGSSDATDVTPNELSVNALRSIAGQMISAGQSRDLFKVYAGVRKTVVEERLDELKIERLNIMFFNRLGREVQKEKIRHWMHAAKVCVRVLFAAEMTLTKQVFDGWGTDTNNFADRCFTITVNDSALRLFNFVDAISNGRKSSEKLFQILDLHQVLSDLLPDIELIFASKSGEVIRKQAVGLLSSLSEIARAMLSEFEKAVFGELTKFTIPEGIVHPLTKYVMNYIHEIVEYKQILTDLIVTKPSISDYIHSGELDFDLSEFEAPPLVLHVVWIIVVLKFKLQLKSKRYKQASLFIKNNVDYIVEEMRGSAELKELAGDAYHIRLISLAEANYRKSSRSNILDFFKCSCFRKIESFTYGVVCELQTLEIG